MIDIAAENARLPRALLVGVAEPALRGDDAPMRELASLAETAGLELADTVILTRLEPTPKYGMGSGKAEEIAALAKAREADQIIFDFEISPTQQRNWDKLAEIPCLDRQELIIRIFAARASTREAVLQVELARLQYSLPRLAHTYGNLSRQRGGRYGTKGAGETQLELDRRGVLGRIAIIKKELAAVKKDRATQRKRRDKVPVPSCAIVGYTNAGKSSLLNALTGAGVLAEDKLFATLDPTTRRFDLPSGRAILLTDTVGFVRNLPHSLVEAFHATLEEAAFADAVVIVLDASDPDAARQLDTTRSVLGEVGAGEKPRVLLLNKSDLVDPFVRSRLREEYPDATWVSARTGEGLADAVRAIEATLSGAESTYLLPLDRQDLVARAHREGSVIEVRYLDEGIEVRARSQGRLRAALEGFEVHDNA